MGRYYRCAVFAVALLASLPAPLAARAADTEPPSAAAPSLAPQETTAHVDGFRSAQWGMTEPQVRAAIRKDFNIGPDKIKSEENLAERTHVVSILVPDLLEGAGTARASYIFGYSTKKLIQVNILWGTAADPQISAEAIVAAADQLRQLFIDSGYDPKTIITNARMNDGEVLVFEGQDAAKHTTILRLAAATETARRGKPDKREKPSTATALTLSYVLDARAPDIYRLKQGQF